MNTQREQWFNEQEQADLELFEKIKNNSKPNVYDLWALSPERFTEWRRINDFPILLNHFDNTLILFKEWKLENKLTNEIIIKSEEITPFIENKKLSKDKKLFLIRQTYNNSSRIFVGYEKLEGVKIDFGTTYKYEILQIFTSYLDWLNSKGKTQQILYINSIHSPNSNIERVFIHANVYAPKTDFELLKMGGIQIPVKGGWILNRGKRMEFVNLSGLKLTGEIYFGELGNLSCSYCSCDNWVAENLNMPLLKFEHCTVKNISLKNSKIESWSFYDCVVTGEFTNSVLNYVKIFGGTFRPIIQNCTIFEVDIEVDEAIDDNNHEGYKILKKIYANQGDDDIAKQYFIKENEYIRKRLKGWSFFTKSLSYYYWEYGRKPHRIIYLSIAIIFLFGIIYWLNNDLIALNSNRITNFTFGYSLYFSTTTYTTLGYGDLSPLGWLRLFTSIEAFLGVINMGFLIAGYSNNKY